MYVSDENYLYLPCFARLAPLTGTVIDHFDELVFTKFEIRGWARREESVGEIKSHVYMLGNLETRMAVVASLLSIEGRLA